MLNARDRQVFDYLKRVFGIPECASNLKLEMGVGEVTRVTVTYMPTVRKPGMDIILWWYERMGIKPIK